jgi:NUMOD3 motif
VDLGPVGHPHSEESKARISAANKGKVPWNVGKKHSEETKARIAEKTKEAMLKRRIATALELGN